MVCLHLHIATLGNVERETSYEYRLLPGVSAGVLLQESSEALVSLDIGDLHRRLACHSEATIAQTWSKQVRRATGC